MLFAQDASGWIGIVGNVANIGFAALVGWYLLTKAMPAMQANFTTELAANRAAFTTTFETQRQEFTEALSTQRTDFANELDRQRVQFAAQDKDRRIDHKDSLAAVIIHCERESARNSEMLKHEMNGLAKVVDDNREVMEEVRDELRTRKNA